jgi:hypothetical protein
MLQTARHNLSVLSVDNVSLARMDGRDLALRARLMSWDRYWDRVERAIASSGHLGGNYRWPGRSLVVGESNGLRTVGPRRLRT